MQIRSLTKCPPQIGLSAPSVAAKCYFSLAPAEKIISRELQQQNAGDSYFLRPWIKRLVAIRSIWYPCLRRETASVTAYLPLSNIYSLYRRKFCCWLLNSTSHNKTLRFPCYTLVDAIYLAIIKHLLAYFNHQAAETAKFMHRQAQIYTHEIKVTCNSH